MNDDKLIAAFEDHSLTREAFTHEAHLRVGWIYISRLPLGAACDTMASELLAWDIAYGLGDRYHETVTWAFMFIIHERQLACEAKTFEEFLEANPDLLRKSPPFLADYYRDETLASDLARQKFLLPDVGR
ncbi:MAG: hypothetical protein HWE25_10260 [Alphaproteobacteria bacterium]|nr:hypothetical protein [Alphaproteobacteria bacterium]